MTELSLLGELCTFALPSGFLGATVSWTDGLPNR